MIVLVVEEHIGMEDDHHVTKGDRCQEGGFTAVQHINVRHLGFCYIVVIQNHRKGISVQKAQLVVFIEVNSQTQCNNNRNMLKHHVNNKHVVFLVAQLIGGWCPGQVQSFRTVKAGQC